MMMSQNSRPVFNLLIYATGLKRVPANEAAGFLPTVSHLSHSMPIICSKCVSLVRTSVILMSIPRPMLPLRAPYEEAEPTWGNRPHCTHRGTGGNMGMETVTVKQWIRDSKTPKSELNSIKGTLRILEAREVDPPHKK